MKGTFAQGLADILLKNGMISADTAQVLKKEFKDRSKEAVDNFLLEEGLVEKEDLLKALSKYFNVPAFDVQGYFFDHYLLKEFPEDFLLRNYLIPLYTEAGENMLVMVASDPLDEDLLPKIGEIVSYDLEFMVGIAPDITDAIEQYYENPLTITDNYNDLSTQEAEEKLALEREEMEWRKYHGFDLD